MLQMWVNINTDGFRLFFKDYLTGSVPSGMTSNYNPLLGPEKRQKLLLIVPENRIMVERGSSSETR